MKRWFLLTVVVACTMQSHAQTLYSLDDCRRMAARHNKELLIAGEKVKQANSLRKAAKTQYLPNISANGGYIWSQKNISILNEDKYLPVYATKNGLPDFASSISNNWAPYGDSYVPLDAEGIPFNPTANPEKIQWKNYAYLPKDALSFDSRNIITAALTMTQPLYMGGKIRALNDIAKSSKKLADAQLEGKTTATILETDAAYWRIVSLSNKEKLAKSYVGLLKKLAGDVEKTIAFGMATKSDELSVRVKLNEAEMSLLQVQDGISLSKMALCQQCGIPLDTCFRLRDENLEEVSELNVESIEMDQAVQNRYEIKSLEQGVRIAKSGKKIMQSRFLPNAGLTAGYITSNPNPYNALEQEFGGQWQIGVIVNVPIFHWGERIHTLHAAEYEKKMAEYQLEDAKEKVELDITQANFKLAEANKKARMTTVNLEKAEENLRLANLGNESGVVATSTVMEAQTAWLKANSEKIDARIDLQMCKVYLQKAQGNLNYER